MMRRLVRRTRRPNGGEDGIAMIMVMGSILVLSLLVTAALGYSLQALPQSRHDQNWNASLAAAQAGVDDYIARLNQSDSYWSTVDCANPALKGGKTGTNTCGWTTSTTPGWQSVAPLNASQGTFHYDVDTSGLSASGVVRVTSTGKVGNASRTIQVLVSRGGSTDFLYYTDFEDADPANTTVYPTGPASNACGKAGPTSASYWWPSTRSGCTEITFIGGDVLDGKVHLNDTPLVTFLNSKQPKFVQGYETSDPACSGGTSANGWAGCWRGTGGPDVNGTSAKYAAVKYLPDNSNAFLSYPGCQYTGDTRIKFNAPGTMTVWSYGSAGTTLAPGCGNPAGPWPQTLSVPTDQVIYIKASATQTKCATGAVGDGLPVANDVNVNEPTFYCGSGNAYIQGTLTGRLTVAAQNNIVVTDDLLLNGVAAGSPPSGPNLLGLVASNSVVTYHPVDNSGNNLSAATTDVWIYASIQTLQHSFWVQSYDQGSPLGTLHVRGSIAQKWRGIVGQGSGTHGFFKDYSYDSRLTFSSPPYFPQWQNAVWGAKTTAELSPAY